MVSQVDRLKVARVDVILNVAARALRNWAVVPSGRTCCEAVTPNIAI